MADKVKPARFEMKEVSVVGMRGDEEKSAEESPHVRRQGQIKQVAPNSESARPIRRQPSESATSDSSKIITSPIRNNQLTPKSTQVKSQRQRARRPTTSAGPQRSRLRIKSASSKGHLSSPRKLMARCTGIKICSGCEKPIREQFLLGACDKYWHEDCLKCDRCHAKLGELGSTLYERANMNLCRQDYLEMFGQKAICAVCDKLIYASEMVMRARDNVYHLECFACQLCGLRFCIGDRFHLCENKIVCQYDYDEHICSLQATMFDYHNNNYQHLPAGPQPPPAPVMGSISPYQRSVPTSEQLGGYMSMLSSNSQTTSANQSDLASCGYSQSMLLGSNQITTTTASILEQETNGNILAMPICDQDQQAADERVELTMLSSCEPLGKSNESEADLSRAVAAESGDCGLDESKLSDEVPQT